MAVAIDGGSDAVTEVAQAVRCMSTTSDSTLKLLSALLGKDNRHDSPNEHLPTTMRKTCMNNAVPPRASNSKRPGSLRETEKASKIIRIHEELNKIPSELSSAKKLALATHTFNATLKTLSALSKDDSSQQMMGPKHNDDTPQRNPILANTSPNKRESSSVPDPKFKGTISKHHDGLQNLFTTIKCARTSLESLYDLRQQQDLSADDTQLELGNLILVAKLRKLHYIPQALSLARELDVGMKRRVKHEPNKIATGIECPDLDLEHTDVPSEHLLTWNTFDCGPNLLKLVADLKITGVQLLITSSVPDSVISALTPTFPYGPFRIIMRLHDTGVLDITGAAKHMTALSQALIESSENSKATEPSVILLLRLFSLEAKVQALVFSNRLGSAETKIWQQVSRFVKTCTESKCSPSRRIFLLYKACLDRIVSAFSSMDVRDSALKHKSMLPPSVSSHLIKLGKHAGLWAEALDLARLSSAPAVRTSTFDTLRNACEVAGISLQVVSLDAKEQLKDVVTFIEALKASSECTSSQEDELLCHLASLRKAAVHVIDLEARGSQTSKRFELAQTCVRACYTITRYVSSCLMAQHAPSVRRSAAVEQDRGSVLATNSSVCATALQTIKICSVALTHHFSDWSETEEAIASACSILKVVRQYHDAARKGPLGDTIASCFVQASNLFWSHYVASDSFSKCQEARDLLVQSINVLQELDLSMQIKGAMGKKLKRLASLYINNGELKSARDVFETLLKLHAASGTAQMVSELAAKWSLQRTWGGEKGDLASLSRSIRSYVKLSLRMAEDHFFDDAILPANIRIALMEKQLAEVLTLQVCPDSDCLIESLLKTSAGNSLLGDSIFSKAQSPLYGHAALMPPHRLRSV